MKTSKHKLKSVMLALVLSVAAMSTASARVCFLPDSTDCGEGDVVGGGDVIIPCKYKTAGEVPLNSAYQEPYKSGMCYYARCKISKSTCEANNGKNKKCCKFDDASNCYYMGDCPKEECPADYIYSAEQAADRKSLLNCSCDPCLTDASKWKCTCPEECSKIEPAGTYTNKCDDSQIPHTAEGVIGSNGQCYTCKDKPVDENCEIKGGCIIDMASIGHNSSSGTIGTGDNTEITYTCYITKAENATEADLQKIYGIMYSDFNCQSSMGQIMSSGYQRVGDVINLSSSPVSGKFTVGELTRLANCQGNTAEYNWDTKIELHNETDHCNFTEEIFTKTCKQLGYINKNNSCSSNDLVKTLVENVIGTDGQCYTCEKAKTCSDYDKTYIETSSIKDNDPEDICPYLYSPVFGYVKNLGNGNTDLKVGEYKFKFGGGDNAEFVDTPTVGCTACRWKTCEEIDSDFTNDPDLLNCEQGYAPEIVKADWAVGSDGRCYECALDRSSVDIVYERSGDNSDGSCDQFNSTNKIEWDIFYDVMHNSGRWFDESKGLPFKVQVVSNYLPTCTKYDRYGEVAEATLILPKGAREGDIYHTYVSNFTYGFLDNYRDKCVKEYNDWCHYDVHNMPLGLSHEEILARTANTTVYLISFNENEDGIPIEKSQYYIGLGNILYNNVYYYFGREQ